MIFYNKKNGKSEEIIIRTFTAGDEPEFKSCICDFYGDGYPYTEYFEPGFLADECKRGKLYLLCAVAGGGEIAGTVAARFDTEFSGSAIMCLRVVKNKFRGMGIATELRGELLNYLKTKDGIKSLFVDALAHDASSQTDLLQFGFVTCGIRPQLYKAHIMIPGGGYKDNDRISQMIMCKAKEDHDAGIIYCPDKHRDFVLSLYKRLNVKCSFGDSASYSISGKSEIIRHDDKLHESVIFIIERTGDDIDFVLNDTITGVIENKIKTAVCYLNMSSAGAENAYSFLTGHGFFFSGIKPLNANGEYMVLSYILSGRPDRSIINACDDGNKLLDYIEADY